jgi:acyl carrier protein
MADQTDTRQEILAKLTDMIEEIAGVHPDDVAEDRMFTELDVDELSMVELAVAVEETYSIRISDAEIAHLTTVGSLVDFVLAARAELEPQP